MQKAGKFVAGVPTEDELTALPPAEPETLEGAGASAVPTTPKHGSKSKHKKSKSAKSKKKAAAAAVDAPAEEVDSLCLRLSN